MMRTPSGSGRNCGHDDTAPVVREDRPVPGGGVPLMSMPVGAVLLERVVGLVVGFHVQNASAVVEDDVEAANRVVAQDPICTLLF